MTSKKPQRGRTVANLSVVMAIAAIVLGAWSWYSRPLTAPEWPDRISGFSFSPFRLGQSPQTKEFPSLNEIRDDLRMAAVHTNRIRTYSVEGRLGDIPMLAAESGLFVTLGIWIGPNLEANEREIARAIEIARTERNVTQVVVGNETQYRADVDMETLISYIDRVRAAVNVPVTTAEQWYVWRDHPELASHVDVIAAHVLPYWEKIDVENALNFTAERIRDLRTLFPHKSLLLAEVGWPSRGRVRGDAEASQSQQAIYLRSLVNMLNQQGVPYFVIELVDQVWKRDSEGSVGAHWGIYDADRQLKFPLAGPVEEIPEWHVLAVISIVLAVMALAFLLIDSSGLRQRGKTFLAAVAFGFGSLLVSIGYDYSQEYTSFFGVVMGVALALGAFGIFLVLFTEAHELAEAVWMRERRRPFGAVKLEDGYRPKVSVHVPCYNEPPAMVKRTLNALAALDYPDFEVIVIDNNTKDPKVWKPIEKYCAKLGPRFRFFHESPLAGFKAGALNFSLKQTAPDAEVIAVIDSDYCVDPNWLKYLVPHFADPDIAIVQAPQDYSDADQSLFKRMCYEEYRGFFKIGMVTRNDRDAIIQHGTMTMIRQDVLQRLGWAEWCITEDAELGLRVFQEGLSAAYTSDSYGKGVMPDTFIDFKKQRFRWAYGAIQIMKRHAGSLLLGRDTALTRGQRYHFVAGWLPWLADGLNIFFSVAAVLYGSAMIIAPTKVDPPLMIFAIPPLALMIFKLGKLLFVYYRTVGVGLADAGRAAIAGLALSHTIAKAVVYGIFTSSIPFFRTPKLAAEHGMLRVLVENREEAFGLTMIWGVALGLILTHPDLEADTLMWVVVLFMQSLPYLAALIMGFLSALPSYRHILDDETDDEVPVAPQ